MSRRFSNVYGDEAWAEAYAGLEFPGTYHLAFRDLPGLLARHVGHGAALDFGCGAGRSSRFLQELGFDVVGVDISEAMLAHARERDPEGDYRLVGADLHELGDARFDLVLCAFPFDNIPGPDHRLHLFRQLGARLTPAGRIVNVVSSPELYVHEWASFSTAAFPDNRRASSGERVRLHMLDVPEKRPVDDLLWTDEDYRDLYERAELELLETHRPLGDPCEPFEWVSETRVAPWVLYVLAARDDV